MTSDLERLKAAYAQWDRSKGEDKAMWMELFADHVDFRSLGAGRDLLSFTAPRKSRAEVRGYLDDLTAAFAMHHYTVEDTVHEGDKIVVYGRTAWTCRSTGRSFETPIMTLWRFEKGQAVAFHEFFDTAMAAAAATP